jgi:hypothetical protein
MYRLIQLTGPWNDDFMVVQFDEEFYILEKPKGEELFEKVSRLCRQACWPELKEAAE